MIIPRLDAGENVFEVLREKFNALAEAVEQLDRLASASPLLDVIDTGAGKLIQWNGPEPGNDGAAPAETAAVPGYAGAFAVELAGGTSARIYNAAAPNGEYAGEIRIGNTFHNMPAGTIPIEPGTAADIYLTVHYDAAGANPGLAYGYSKTLSEPVTGVQGWYKKLAHVDGTGTVTQMHLSGDIEICGRWI
jgi:hypothetical protein